FLYRMLFASWLRGAPVATWGRLLTGCAKAIGSGGSSDTTQSPGSRRRGCEASCCTWVFTAGDGASQTSASPPRPSWQGPRSPGIASGGLCRTYGSVAVQKAAQTGDGIAEVVHPGQEHNAEVLGVRQVEGGAVDQQQFFLEQQFQ